MAVGDRETRNRMAKASAGAEIEQLMESWGADPAPATVAQLDQLSSKIAGVFGVKTDEVAILAITAKGMMLRFVVPAKLQTVGTIPLSSTTALVAKTARERRAEIQNNFASARHASVFEGVPLGRNPGETIQKIMSAPILRDGKTAGVIQISRKGRTPETAGPDFLPEDLRKLQSLGPPLSKFLEINPGQ